MKKSKPRKIDEGGKTGSTRTKSRAAASQKYVVTFGYTKQNTKYIVGVRTKIDGVLFICFEVIDE